MEKIKAGSKGSTCPLPRKGPSDYLTRSPSLDKVEGPNYRDVDMMNRKYLSDREVVLIRNTCWAWGAQLNKFTFGYLPDVLSKDLAIQFVQQAGFQWTNRFMMKAYHLYLHWNYILNMFRVQSPRNQFQKKRGIAKDSSDDGSPSSWGFIVKWHSLT